MNLPYNPMQQTPEYCEFCQLLKDKSQNNLVIAQDQTLFAFHDLVTATAQAHVLICTKQHIESALTVHDINLLSEMEKFGEEVLGKVYFEMFKRQPQRSELRLGFHLPPHISIFHIHLHGFILPFQNKLYDKYLYGFGLKSIEVIKERRRQVARL